MQIIHSVREVSESCGTVGDIWSCGCCGKVHLKFGEVVISLGTNAYRSFVLRAAEVYAETITTRFVSREEKHNDDDPTFFAEIHYQH